MCFSSSTEFIIKGSGCGAICREHKAKVDAINRQIALLDALEKGNKSMVGLINWLQNDGELSGFLTFSSSEINENSRKRNTSKLMGK